MVSLLRKMSFLSMIVTEKSVIGGRKEGELVRAKRSACRSRVLSKKADRGVKRRKKEVCVHLFDVLFGSSQRYKHLHILGDVSASA